MRSSHTMPPDVASERSRWNLRRTGYVFHCDENPPGRVQTAIPADPDRMLWLQYDARPLGLLRSGYPVAALLPSLNVHCDGHSKFSACVFCARHVPLPAALSWNLSSIAPSTPAIAAFSRFSCVLTGCEEVLVARHSTGSNHGLHERRETRKENGVAREERQTRGLPAEVLLVLRRSERSRMRFPDWQFGPTQKDHFHVETGFRLDQRWNCSDAIVAAF